MENFTYSTKPDFSITTRYSAVPVEQIYSVILIDKTQNNYPIFDSNKITLLNKRTKSVVKQSIVFEKGTIMIGETEHDYYHIAPGLRIKHPMLNNYEIQTNTNTYPLSFVMKPKSHKFIIGSLILSDNYYSYFDDNSIIDISLDGVITEATIDHKKNRFNLYSNNKVTTILNILNDKNIDLLYTLNNNSTYGHILARSRKSRIEEKGSIQVLCKNTNNIQYSVKCSCIGLNYSAEYNMTDSLTIKDLSVGDYNLSIWSNNTEIYSTNFTIVPFVENAVKKTITLPIFKISNKLIES
jgi:hypothetical protein